MTDNLVDDLVDAAAAAADLLTTLIRLPYYQS